jgi:hypothetical protein
MAQLRGMVWRAPSGSRPGLIKPGLVEPTGVQLARGGQPRESGVAPPATHRSEPVGHRVDWAACRVESSRFATTRR